MMRLLIGALSFAVLFQAQTLANAQPAKKAQSAAPKKSTSVAARTATCRADCRSGNTHGLYRAYNTADPNLISPEGRRMYAECVRLCLAPLPTFYLQRPIIEGGLWWFGMTKSDCLTCHAAGETKGRATGVIMQPDALRR